MASKASQTQLAILAVALITISSFFSAASAGRPCKTLLISSFSFSLRRHPHLPPSAGGFVTVFTHIESDGDADDDDDAGPALRLFLPDVPHRPRPRPRPRPESVVGPNFPFPASASSYDLSSLRDRTRDILSVVVALLFGVGCGALTAATLYLAWSLFAAPRYYRDGQDFDSSSEDGDYDGIPSPKKVGYVKIPASAAAPAAEEPAKQAGAAAV